MKKSNANGDCKWQLPGRWELARCLFCNALCRPCIVWNVYLDEKKIGVIEEHMLCGVYQAQNEKLVIFSPLQELTIISVRHCLQ